MKQIISDRGLTFQELLTIPPLDQAIVHSGDIGLGNIVRQVNVMEVPDVINWVQKGEFLMTTGYPFRDNPERFFDLIPELAKRKISGLGIKTKRFLDEIPSKAIELARQYELPLVELPESTVFSEVMRTVMERVFYNESRHISVLQDRMQFFTQLLIENQKLDVILAELENIVGNPILLLNESNSCIYKSDILTDVEELTNYDWERIRERLLLKSDEVFLLNLENDRSVTCHISSVPGKKENPPLLMVFELKTRNTPIDLMTIERTSSLIGLELVNLEVRKSIEMKYFDQFIGDWLQGHLQTESDIELRAEASGCILRKNVSYCVVMIRWLEEVPKKYLSIPWLRDRIQQTPVFHSKKDSQQNQSFISLLNGEVVYVIETKSHTKQYLETILLDIYERLETGLGVKEEKYPFTLCVGNVVHSLTAVNESYLQAKSVIHISDVCNLEQQIVSYEDLGIYRLLSLLPNSTEIDEFVRSLLGPLIKYDLDNSKNLLETLECYFQTKSNLKETAKALYTHYNTIVYRVQKIRSLLYFDFDDPNVQLQLQIAMKIYLIRPKHFHRYILEM